MHSPPLPFFSSPSSCESEGTESLEVLRRRAMAEMPENLEAGERWIERETDSAFVREAFLRWGGVTGPVGLSWLLSRVRPAVVDARFLEALFAVQSRQVAHLIATNPYLDDRAAGAVAERLFPLLESTLRIGEGYSQLLQDLTALARFRSVQAQRARWHHLHELALGEEEPVSRQGGGVVRPLRSEARRMVAAGLFHHPALPAEQYEELYHLLMGALDRKEIALLVSVAQGAGTPESLLVQLAGHVEGTGAMERAVHFALLENPRAERLDGVREAILSSSRYGVVLEELLFALDAEGFCRAFRRMLAIGHLPGERVWGDPRAEALRRDDLLPALASENAELRLWAIRKQAEMAFSQERGEGPRGKREAPRR